MAKFQFPQSGRFSQPNTGDVEGNLQMTYGVDLRSNKGKIKNSPIVKSVFNEDDDADFNTILQGIAKAGYYNTGSDTGRFMAITQGKIFTSGVNDPTTWTENTATSVPTCTNRSDVVAFGNSTAQLFFVSGDSTGTIYYKSGEDSASAGLWQDWWISIKGKSALNTNTYTPMRVAQSKLWIVDYQMRVYYCPTDVNGTPVTSGNGTLDLRYSDGYRILTLEPTSTRMWFGCYRTQGGGGVIEWDMSANSSTANRFHALPDPVICIFIWNDSPYAITSIGEIYSFNGTNFEKYAQLPIAPNFQPYSDPSGSFFTPDAFNLMHPRGWAIIDGMPHFLINNQAYNATALTGSKQGNWKMPSGIYCLDPEIGVYCRYVLDYDAVLGTTVGSQAIAQPGALLATQVPTARFIGGARFYTDSSGTDKLSMFVEDVDRTYATRSRFALQPLEADSPQIWQMVEALHKKLENSSDRILLKYRLTDDANLPDSFDVTWASTTSFTTTDADFANVSVGDEVYVILGNGAGCSEHVSAISEAGGTYTVTLNGIITGVSASDTGTVRCDNWKLLATISNQMVDYHDYTIRDAEASRKLELLVEMRASAGSVIEIDKLAVTSKDV